VPPSVVPDPGLTPATCSPFDGPFGFLPQEMAKNAVRIRNVTLAPRAALSRGCPLTWSSLLPRAARWGNQAPINIGKSIIADPICDTAVAECPTVSAQNSRSALSIWFNICPLPIFSAIVSPWPIE
jgi:hypothetical protein